MWRQCFKALWLKEGDQNTTFFHSKAYQQLKWKNAIHRIKDSDGVWKEDEAKNQVILSYFSILFMNSSDRWNAEFLDPLCARASEDHNSDISKAYSKDEIKEAFKQMNPIKALGLDGMALIFFQKF